MATQTQYDVFLYLYEEENKRYEHLQDRAKLYLSIASIYLAAIAFKVDDVLRLATQFRIPAWLWLMTGGILIAAVVLISWAVCIRDYEGICDPIEVIATYVHKPPLSDEDFLNDRLGDLAAATNLNSAVNTRVARLLKWAAVAIIIAFSLQLAFFAIAAYNRTHAPPKNDPPQAISPQKTATSGNSRSANTSGHR